ncbi:MAG: hypothetical protein LBD04_01970 [Synergistaceae bacterium]|jgi:hypothetical protein|nr:hypothetical protein [Synergistaceae bacterium]
MDIVTHNERWALADALRPKTAAIIRCVTRERLQEEGVAAMPMVRAAAG